MDTIRVNEIIKEYSATFPIPVGSIANALGINVYTTSGLPANTSGSIVHEKDGSYSIYVKEGQSPRRQRFTIAHEIGHYVEHADDLQIGDEMLSPLTKKPAVMYRPNKTSEVPEDVKEREVEADQFAANLLMPKDEFKKIWQKSNSLQEVADYFGVSPMAANIRGLLLNLGYFDEAIHA